MPSHESRRGITVIEVVVVIIVLALLAILLTPAIAQVRSRARAPCMNRLKQIGLALHNYHDAHKCFPPGMLENDASWSILLLPFLEQDSLEDVCRAFDFEAASIAKSEGPRTEGALTGAQAASIPFPQVWRCPSDTGSETFHGVALSNYVGNFGPAAPANGSTRDPAGGGFFRYGAAVRLRDVRDGTSNTIMVGERRTEEERTWFDNMAVWSAPALYDIDRAALIWGWGSDRMNSGVPGSFSSPHEGGTHFLMGDGRVIFVVDSIDFNANDVDSTQGVFQNLLDRADGQVLGEF